jgi:ABC-type Zn uptake system ZnuABC Zn-binding protein ZnuA
VNKFKTIVGLYTLILLASIGLSACTPGISESLNEIDHKLKIVATTTFVGDVVGNIVGEEADITILLQPGENPHAYQVTPQDMVDLSQADVIFANGLGLEEFLDELLEGSDSSGKVVIVSEGISVLIENGNDDNHHQEGDHRDHAGVDPHVWFDPNNVIIWTHNIENALTEIDPDQVEIYHNNAEAYRTELLDLDAWIQTQVDQISPEKRKFVTDHTSFGYFAEAYGFELIGAVIPSLTTESETSGQGLAELVENIKHNQVEAIFLGIDFDPTLSQRIAEEVGIDLVPLYFGSLSDGPPADTYLNFMRYNVSTIVETLK